MLFTAFSTLDQDEGNLEHLVALLEIMISKQLRH